MSSRQVTVPEWKGNTYTASYQLKHMLGRAADRKQEVQYVKSDNRCKYFTLNVRV